MMSVEPEISRSDWQERVAATACDLLSLIPPKESFILVDEEQIRAALPEGVDAIPFLERDGEYWGPPPNDPVAIWELERLREAGARYIAFAWPAFWWLDHYSGLREHLVSRFTRVAETADLMLFDLSVSGNVRDASAYGAPAVPNDADEWERVCLTPVEPVTRLSSAVARSIADLTRPGDLLLEAGCGWAGVSAELATAGRRIALADFSRPILDRARALFEASRLPAPETTCCDLTEPLPWTARTFDVVWSSGVLEHWTDEELVPIVLEMARVSRRSVISLVPFAGCVLYRLGKHLAEEAGRWPYGRELPRQTLQPVFERAGLTNIREYTVWSEWAPRMLRLTQPRLQRAVARWWESLPPDDPVKRGQGYLLLTVGDSAG